MKWWGTFCIIVGIGTGILPEVGLTFRPALLMGDSAVLFHIGLSVFGLILLSIGYFKPRE